MTKPVGDAVDGLLARVRADGAMSETELLSIVATAIRASGVEAEALKPDASVGNGLFPDLAVWVDELSPVVGNPLPIEIKRSLATRPQSESAAKVVARTAMAAGARWGLLLYVSATPDAVRALATLPVLAMSVEDFLEGLRTRSFARVVTDLRNQAAGRVRSDG